MNDVDRGSAAEDLDRTANPTPSTPSPAGAPAQDDQAAGRRRWGGRLLALAAFMLLCAALAHGAWQYTLRQDEVTKTAERRRNLVPSVRVATVTASPATISANLPATALAFASANMFARVSGYIQKRSVDIGDRVKKGQLLAEISAPEIEHQISQAEAQLVLSRAALVQAKANRDLAQITWDRDRPLVEKGWVPKQKGSIDEQNLKAQEAADGVAEATVKAQEAQLNVLLQQRTYMSIIAPFDGIVTQRNIDVGDLVQGDTTGGTFLFTVMQSDVIRTQVFVPQYQALGLEPGVKAVVRVPEIPDRTFPGKVTRVAHALQPGSRTLLAEIDVPNPDGHLSPGMYCSIELEIPRKAPSLSVPSQAIIFNSDGLQVAVVQDDVAHIRKITVQRDLGTEIEVSDGVNEGDKVILSPPVGLADGSRVDIR